jgi:hypothetical protein
MAEPNDPVRAALEEAKQRPLPPPEEREQLMEMARAAMKTPKMSTEEFLATLAEQRVAAAE